MYNTDEWPYSPGKSECTLNFSCSNYKQRHELYIVKYATTAAGKRKVVWY